LSPTDQAADGTINRREVKRTERQKGVRIECQQLMALGEYVRRVGEEEDTGKTPIGEHERAEAATSHVRKAPQQPPCVGIEDCPRSTIDPAVSEPDVRPQRQPRHIEGRYP